MMHFQEKIELLREAVRFARHYGQLTHPEADRAEEFIDEIEEGSVYD